MLIVSKDLLNHLENVQKQNDKLPSVIAKRRILAPLTMNIFDLSMNNHDLITDEARQKVPQEYLSSFFESLYFYLSIRILDDKSEIDIFHSIMKKSPKNRCIIFSQLDHILSNDDLSEIVVSEFNKTGYGLRELKDIYNYAIRYKI